MKLLKKEFRLCLHPTVYLMALLSAEAGASLPLPTFMGFGSYETGGMLAMLARRRPGAVRLRSYASPDSSGLCRRSSASFRSSSLTSMGLAIWAFMPASRQRLASSA